MYADDLKDFFVVEYSPKGSHWRPAEEQAWLHFSDFLDECEGTSYKLCMYGIHSHILSRGPGLSVQRYDCVMQCACTHTHPFFLQLLVEVQAVRHQMC